MIINNEKHYDLIKFEDGDFSSDVEVSPDEDTVWLSANQIAILFSRDEKTIRKHINNVFLENEVDKYSNTQKMRVAGVDQMVKFYSLNVIISVGYRVKSKRGVIFRQWANTILKEYLLIRGIINSGELNKKSVLAKFAYTAFDGKIYNESNMQKMQIPFSDKPIFLYFFSMNNKNIIVLKN